MTSTHRHPQSGTPLRGTESSTALRGRLAALAKLAVTVGVVTFVVTHVDLGGALASAKSLSLAAVSAVLGLLLSQHLISALRLKLTLRFVERPLAFSAALRSQLVGAFFSQSFLTFVAADGMRVWMLHRSQVPLRDATGAVFLDRVLGFASLALFVALGLPWLLALLPREHAVGVVTAASMIPVGVLGLIGVGFVPESRSRLEVLAWLRQQSTRLRTLAVAWRASAPIVALGFGLQLANVLAIFALAHSLGLSLALVDCAILIPAVLLLAMLPISVGGWGVREGAMIVGLGLVGIEAEASVVISILFGLAVAVASLPGAAVWLRARVQRAPCPAAPAV